MPVIGFRDRIEVLVELPPEPGLPDAADAGDREQSCLALVGSCMEEVLDRLQLAVATDERRLEPRRLERAAQTRHDAKCPPHRRQPFLALELEAARVLVDDRVLGGATGSLTDEDAAGGSCGLYPRRSVDEISRDHAFALRAERDRRLAGENTRACAELLGADLLTEGGDGGHDVQRRPNRALGVVLGGCRRAPDRHHGVADEFLNRAAVDADDAATRLEVA